MMKDLVELLVKALVDRPDDVQISQVQGERAVVLEVRVAPDDVGKVIGKQGRIIHALRVVAKAAAAREGKRVVLEVLS
ncbi:MAG: KH domain-containing protein [Acetobacteraceae bacterium]|nr:KH domain-containing protein [Acetobacteraceae bacterium]